jgi:diguanylate cyclase (GGDEF)-like protein
MLDPLTPQTPPPAPRRSRSKALTIHGALLFAAASAAGALTLPFNGFIAMDDPLPWVLLVALSIAIVLAALGGLLRHYFEWRRSLLAFHNQVEQARTGEMPIEALSETRGRLRPLAKLIQEMLREIRRNDTELAQLEQEMTQRVAQRTNALERRLGLLRTQANKDPLTGLNNRRGLDAILAQMIEQAELADSDLCVLMLDLNNFKSLNDTLGHGAGDDLLRNVGQIIRSTVRDGDLAFRCGGDEFVIVLPNAGIEAGDRLVERLTSLVEGLSRTIRTPMKVGLGAGIATLSEAPRPSPDALLELADKRLYAMKRVWKAAERTGAKKLAS